MIYGTSTFNDRKTQIHNNNKLNTNTNVLVYTEKSILPVFQFPFTNHRPPHTPLLQTQLPPPTEICNSPSPREHYHIFGLKLYGFIFDIAFACWQSKNITYTYLLKKKINTARFTLKLNFMASAREWTIPTERQLAKLVTTFADIRCHVVSMTIPMAVFSDF
jgi:hypothetical protein